MYEHVTVKFSNGEVVDFTRPQQVGLTENYLQIISHIGKSFFYSHRIVDTFNTTPAEIGPIPE